MNDARCTQELDEVQLQLDALSRYCAGISSALAAARTSGAALLSDADKGSRALAALETRQQGVEAFLQQYTLAEEEVRAACWEEGGGAGSEGG
jgi:hypothetical protein